MKKIIVTGATGLIGRKLVASLIEKKFEVIILSRDVRKAKSMFPDVKDFVEWDYQKPDEWKSRLENADAVIHLAGVNLFAKRWNSNFKKMIKDSREVSTKNLVEAIIHSNNKAKVFISASGIGFYGDRNNEVLTENSTSGNDFIAEVCNAWELESQQLNKANIRNVQIRTGLVLSKEDGALKQMLPAFKFFVGGPLGNGKQWTSWLHIDDIVGMYLHALDNDKISGPLNAVSSNPIRMKEFAKTLGKVIKRPSLFPVPKFMLKIIIGEAAEVVTGSQKVIPDKLIKNGYKFKFTKLEDALKDLLK
jgi:uncharacterized protein (TIGR01777 family)